MTDKQYDDKQQAELSDRLDSHARIQREIAVQWRKDNNLPIRNMTRGI